MACTYCAANQLPRARMGESAGQRAIDMFLDLGNGAETVEFSFSGGEPFLEFPLFRCLVLYAEKRTGRAGVSANFTVKTNGTILNSAIRKFLREHGIRVFVSIDGAAEAHDRYRKKSNGEPTHHIVSRNLAILLESGIVCEASMSVHPTMAYMVPENVRWLHSLGVNHISIGPVYGDTTWSESEGRRIAATLKDVAEYAKRINKTGPVLEVGPLYRESEHIGSQLRSSWGCGAASTNLAFLPDGQIAGCSALAMLTPRFPHLAIGDVKSGLNNDAVGWLLDVAQAGVENRPQCQTCLTATDCSGGCLAINYAANNSPFSPPHFYCKMISAIPSALATVWNGNQRR